MCKLRALFQSSQREPSVIKILRSSLSAEFSKHCVLNGGTQRRAFVLLQEEAMASMVFF